MGEEPMSIFNWVFEYQPMPSEIKTQPKRYKGEESNLLTDKNSPHYLSQIVVWVIHLSL